MPERFDVAIVGGGLLGCALAWYLSRSGTDVVVLEQDEINQHASGRNAGSLHFQLEYRMFENGFDVARQAAEAMPLHLDAAQAWGELPAELGEDLGVELTGGLMLAETTAEVALLERKAELERSYGLGVEILAADELGARAPYLSSSVLAASYCGIEGKADARVAAPALARAAARLGAQIRTKTRVEGLERAGGRWALRSAARDGAAPAAEPIEAEAVAITAGVWTTAVAQTMDVVMPTVPLGLTMSVSARTEPFIKHLVQHAGTRLSLKQSAEGNVLIGGGWPALLPRDDSGRPRFDRQPELQLSSLAGNCAAAMQAIPALEGLPILRAWTGSTVVTPDQLPLLGPIPGRPGGFVATGGSAFTLGPTYARLLSELIMVGDPELDLSRYSPLRFQEVGVA